MKYWFSMVGVLAVGLLCGGDLSGADKDKPKAARDNKPRKRRDSAPPRPDRPGEQKKDSEVEKADAKKPAKTRRSLPPYYKGLNLTDAQKQKIYDIRARYKGPIAELNRQLKEARAKQTSELESVLTDEQKARLKSIRGSKKSRTGKSTKTTDMPKKTGRSKRKDKKKDTSK